MNVQEQVYHLLKEGYSQRVSDMYLFPHPKGYQITFRQNNQQRLYRQINQSLGEKILVHLKYLADMDVAEKRRMQVGSATYPLDEKVALRLRFSTVADYQNRESMVVRFLYTAEYGGTFITFLPKMYQKLLKESRKSGLYLFSGPTGSGKTTTMYHLAQHLAKNQQVITIEDPVEMEQPAFLQLQINEAIEATYERLVQLCLRHRPDILIVGEIRDEQTARAVVRGALTGHTIFSTVHASDGPGVWLRLIELGVSPEELKQCLKGITYQRLLPIYCPYCEKKCSAYCPTKQVGVLYDSYFLEERGEVREIFQAKDRWNERLKKIWALGYITEETYLAFQH